jgi:hypothetical protein
MSHKTTEITLAMQLVLELMYDIGLKGRTKQLGNMFVKELEKTVESNYQKLYNEDPEIITNIMNAKHRVISQLAELNEADCVLLYDIVNAFVDNIEEVRKHKVTYFTKLL